MNLFQKYLGNLGISLCEDLGIELFDVIRVKDLKIIFML